MSQSKASTRVRPHLHGYGRATALRALTDTTLRSVVGHRHA